MLRLPRITISVACSVAMLGAQILPGLAQNAASIPTSQAAFTPAEDVTPSPAILAAFKEFPKGGEQLSKRIEDIIKGNPKLAPGLAKYLQTATDLNKEQKQAAFRGLAAGLNRLGINAAELPVYKEGAPPPVAYGEGPPPGLLVAGLAAAALAGICVVACVSENAPVSP
jgi:hypothetical protein